MRCEILALAIKAMKTTEAGDLLLFPLWPLGECEFTCVFVVDARRLALTGWDVAAEVETTRLFAPPAGATCFAMSCANLRLGRRGHAARTDY